MGRAKRGVGTTIAPVARKGLDAALRVVGHAPEQRAARRLGPVAANPGGRRIAFLTPRSWAFHVQAEAMIARGLALRGADVSFLTCGGGRSICDRAHVYEGPPMPCRSCSGYTAQSLDAHGHRWQPLQLGDGTGTEPAWPELDGLGLDELRAVTCDGLPLGELVEPAVCWYLCSTDLERDPIGARTLRAFLRSGAAVADQLDAALGRLQPETVVLLNGMFLFEAIARSLCERRGIEVISYERGYAKGTMFFSRGLPASRYDISHCWDSVRGRPLTPAEERALDDYLVDRQFGRRATSSFWPDPQFVEPEPGFTLMATNVTWDTAAQRRERCFGSVRQWVLDTVSWFADRPDRRLVVRAHPAEVRTPGAQSREPVGAIIASHFGTLPPNVTLIEADDPVSTYPYLRCADVVLVYTSTVGLEAALAGKPCITAGDAHFVRKGFSLDPADRDDYFQVLAHTVANPEAVKPDVGLARRYASFFFFGAQVPSDRWVWEPQAGLARITSDSQVLRPGEDEGLDRICEWILGPPTRLSPCCPPGES